jgi:hypothetical protein
MSLGTYKTLVKSNRILFQKDSLIAYCDPLLP